MITGCFARIGWVGFWLILAGAGVYGQGGPPTIVFPKIDRRPPPAAWTRGPLTSLPHFDASRAREDSWQLDLRQRDVSSLLLRSRLDDLLYASFDGVTKWPPAQTLPDRFDPASIMEVGRNPGLGVRKLHRRGITGRGVGVAIIDQTLLVDHQEYLERLRLYEETDDITGGWMRAQMPAQMHGAAVASISVGETVGVAPEADLYYIATSRGVGGEDFTYLARGIRRILAVNKQLPANRKIRVIAMAIGWEEQPKGFEEVTAATEEAKAAGMLVVCSSIERVHGLRFNGLGRPPLADPDLFESYEPGLFWTKDFRELQQRPDRANWLADRLLVPMDSRTTASPHSSTGYVFYRQGGWSWSIPYIAGLYALAAQTDPTITPERFWKLALSTGETISVRSGDSVVPLGPIVNPAKLIDALQPEPRASARADSP